MTNDGAEDFRLMEAPDDDRRTGPTGPRSSRPGPASGSTTSTPSPVTWWSTSGRTGETRIRVIDAASGTSDPSRSARVALDGVGRGQPRVRLHHPPLRVHLAGHPPLGLRPRPGDRRRPSCGSASRSWADFDPARYRTERRWAAADDGTEVPISLVYRPDLVADSGERHAEPGRRVSSTATAPTRPRSTRPSRPFA